jgi:hypothetical protein
MVFVWSQLTRGDPYFTLSQVAVNDLIMIVAFAPIVALLLGLSAITVPWDTLLASVVLYIVIPVVAAQLWRKWLQQQGAAALAGTIERIQPYSIGALLVTLVLLFAFQGQQILGQPLVIAMLAVPIIIQVYFNAALAYGMNRRFGVALCRRAIGADRRQQLLRAGRGSGDQPFRRRIRRRAGNRRGGTDRGAGDAHGGEDRQRLESVVRTHTRGIMTARCSNSRRDGTRT